MNPPLPNHPNNHYHPPPPPLGAGDFDHATVSVVRNCLGMMMMMRMRMLMYVMMTGPWDVFESSSMIQSIGFVVVVVVVVTT